MAQEGSREWYQSQILRMLCVRVCVRVLPARLLCPCDSPGKNTGVGCHFRLQGNLLPNPGIKQASLASPALAARFFATEPLGKPPGLPGPHK